MALPKLPKEVHVAWEENGNDATFLIASEKADGAADSPEWRTVGVYRLVKTIKVRESYEVQTKS